MDGNLAKINYDTYGTVTELPTKKCLNDALAIFENGVIKLPGKES
jgi:hypothetical protein